MHPDESSQASPAARALRHARSKLLRVATLASNWRLRRLPVQALDDARSKENTPTLRMGYFLWWLLPDSNWGHKALQASALPTELKSHTNATSFILLKNQRKIKRQMQLLRQLLFFNSVAHNFYSL